MTKTNDIIFPFGEHLFIGIIKFFDIGKGFGYIVSNNYGMESLEKFSKSPQLQFLIDNSSWKARIAAKNAVCFRPAIKGTILRAENVRLVLPKTDKKLILKYYEENNFISLDNYPNKSRCYNILMKCGISRHQLINEYTNTFSKTHDFNYLLDRINAIINDSNGEEEYNKQLRFSQKNQEKELSIWKRLFKILSEEQIQKLLHLHPSLQICVDDSFLLQHIEDINIKWGVSSVVAKALKDIKLRRIEQLIDSKLVCITRENMENIRQKYKEDLSYDRLSILNRCIDDKTISIIVEKIAGLNANKVSEFIQTANSISEEYEHLSKDGVDLFRYKLADEYEEKITYLVDGITIYEWNNSLKKEVKEFILNDKIIATEKFINPQQHLKKIILNDYDKLFIQDDSNKNQFCCHSDFENLYACLFTQDEHKIILEKIETKCLEEGGFFSIIGLFTYIGKKLPDNIKNRFLNLPLKTIISNLSIMDRFDDKGFSLLSPILDRILNINDIAELKNYILKPDLKNILSTNNGQKVIINIILKCNCSNKVDIEKAIILLELYNGMRTELLKQITNSDNKYLKILVWALYFQSSGKTSDLKDVLHFYPTDLQIRIVKKIFSTMALNSFPPSLDKLKSVLGYNYHELSSPVEIVLKYLSKKKVNPNANITDSDMIEIIYKKEDYNDWHNIRQMLHSCNGRRYIYITNNTNYTYKYHGTIKKCIVNGKNVYRTIINYNNQYDSIREYISITFDNNKFKNYRNCNGEQNIYDFDTSEEKELRIMAEVYHLKMDGVNYNYNYNYVYDDKYFCCECRVSEKPDKLTQNTFMWCKNKACYQTAPHFHTSSEWEKYTVLDFMRILSIPTQYSNKKIRHGQYTIFSSFILYFFDLFEHLKCRKCNKLMEPYKIGNYGRSALTEFYCSNNSCSQNNIIVYLNICFKCNGIIDSRDSKKCPNGMYICTKCGTCCSNSEYQRRLERLKETGGYISDWLNSAIRNKVGHLEKNELYCSSCGRKMDNKRKCSCGNSYN